MNLKSTRNNGKLLRTAVLLLLIPSLCGAVDKIELLDKNKKLIDLEKAMSFSRRGGDSLENQFIDDDGESSQGERENKAGSTPENITESRIIITVSGRNIKYNGKAMKAGEDFKLKVQTNMNTTQKVIFVLVDDYADSRVYKQVKKTLRNNNAVIQEVTND